MTPATTMNQHVQVRRACQSQVRYTHARRHPICRGDFAALVFSGSTHALGEIPGELTALALYKFVLPDSSLSPADDFDSCAHMTLPEWPCNKVYPTPGVCFVFADELNPHLLSLRQFGAIRDEHYVVLDKATDKHDFCELARIVQQIEPDGRLLILGFGQQGLRIASYLINNLDISPQQLFVYDANDDSCKRAQSFGCTAIPIKAIDLHAFAITIYSPETTYKELIETFNSSLKLGAVCFDNRRTEIGLAQFTNCESIAFDAAASRSLVSQGRVIRSRSNDLAWPCSYIREDIRRFGKVELPHLHSGHRHLFIDKDSHLDLNVSSPTDNLASSTYIKNSCAFVSLRETPDLGFFASRHLCNRLWPEATKRIFPAQHAIDLGTTSFERLLQCHLDSREIVASMQTASQRVVLGAAAAHYASDRPIVEIGSALGGSALHLAAATEMSDREIYSIDPDTATRDIMRFAFSKYGFEHRLKQLVMTSQEAASRFDCVSNTVGLVFIDGLHTTDGVLFDFDNYSSLIAPGGALLFHDVVPQLFSVMRMAVERMMNDSRFVAKCLVDGLLVLERKLY